MCDGYNERRQREWRAKQPELYLLRFIGATLHNIGAGFSKGAKAIKPKDLMELPDMDSPDGETPSARPDPERFRELVTRDGKKLPDGFPDRNTSSST